MKKYSLLRQRLASVLVGTSFAFLGLAQADDDWEWDNTNGYHEEEWYDPSDWFNDDSQVDYEYDYPYYSDSYWTNDLYSGWDDDVWYGDYDYTLDDTSHYRWDYANNEWTYDDDLDYSTVDYTVDNDYEGVGEDIDLAGTVTAFRTLNIGEGIVSEERTFVKITLEDGTSRVVDLGRKVDLAELNLNQGDEVQVMGREAMVGDNRVLKASKIDVADQSFEIDRDYRQFNIEGTIKNFKMASLGDRREDHLLIRLEIEDGKEMIVDFGPGADLSAMDLDNGDSIRVQGRRATVDGKSILVAGQVTVNGVAKATGQEVTQN